MAADDNLEIILEQYKAYLDGIEKNSDRRGKALASLISLNSLYFAGVGIAVEFLGNYKWVMLMALCVLGISTSITFYFLIRSYRQLNSGKFKVLHSMETKLPMQPYTEEWKVLGEGKDRQKYWPFSHIEKVLPIIFVIAYGIGLAAILFTHINIVISINP